MPVQTIEKPNVARPSSAVPTYSLTELWSAKSPCQQAVAVSRTFGVGLWSEQHAECFSIFFDQIAKESPTRG
jgi:hypothetical protein